MPLKLTEREKAELREQIYKTQGYLTFNEAEHEALVNLLEGYQGWLELHKDDEPEEKGHDR